MNKSILFFVRILLLVAYVFTIQTSNALVYLEEDKNIYLSFSSKKETNFNVFEKLKKPVSVKDVMCFNENIETPFFIKQPSEKTLVANGSSTFVSASISSKVGVEMNYQWQLSTNNGLTWTNISNSKIYSGVTTTKLNISAVKFEMNNYKYKLNLFQEKSTQEKSTQEKFSSNISTLNVFLLPEICNDGIDNDNNGFTDAADVACGGNTFCTGNNSVEVFE